MILKFKIKGESELSMMLQNTITMKKQARHLMKVYAPVYSKHYLASNN